MVKTYNLGVKLVALSIFDIIFYLRLQNKVSIEGGNEMNLMDNFLSYKWHTRHAGPGFSYSCRKHFVLTNNETCVSGFF